MSCPDGLAARALTLHGLPRLLGSPGLNSVESMRSSPRCNLLPRSLLQPAWRDSWPSQSLLPVAAQARRVGAAERGVRHLRQTRLASTARVGSASERHTNSRSVPATDARFSIPTRTLTRSAFAALPRDDGRHCDERPAGGRSQPPRADHSSESTRAASGCGLGSGLLWRDERDGAASRVSRRALGAAGTAWAALAVERREYLAWFPGSGSLLCALKDIADSLLSRRLHASCNSDSPWPRTRPNMACNPFRAHPHRSSPCRPRAGRRRRR